MTSTVPINPLAVPYLGAMALKRQSAISVEMRQYSCSPLPRGDGAETWARRSFSCTRCLAVPYLGAMALKRTIHHCAMEPSTSCSPLPRGDGAETGLSTPYMSLLSFL